MVSKPTHVRVKTATLGSSAAVLLAYVLRLPNEAYLALVPILTYAAGWLPDAN